MQELKLSDHSSVLQQNSASSEAAVMWSGEARLRLVGPAGCLCLLLQFRSYVETLSSSVVLELGAGSQRSYSSSTKPVQAPHLPL